ncbi:MAG: RsiV family protein [Bacteroidota bacterium]
MRFFPIKILLLLLPIYSWGQMDTKQYVESMFEKGTKLRWVKHYKGRIDDLNDISVTLGFDGELCKGQMTFLRSDTKLDLSGVVEGSNIVLQELDNNQKVSGIIKGQITKNTIKGSWKNYDGTQGGDILLHHTEMEAKFPSFCGDNKWIRKYVGILGKDKFEMILQKENATKLSGLIFYQRQNISYQLFGKINGTGKIEVKVKNQDGLIVQKLSGSLEKDRLTMIDEQSSYKNKEVLTPIDGLTINCVEYADYTTGYDITFPKTVNATFNRRMTEETEAWVKACENHAKRVKKQNTSNAPQTRSSERGYAWSEVEYFSKNLISGFMTFSNTWTPGQKLIAFNFDFQKNSTIYLEDIFKEEKDYKKFIRNYIKKAVRGHELYSNDDYKKWIKKNDFPFFTIRKDGICFSTKFNMIYGRQSVTIPYQKLQPYLKKDFIKLLSK